MTSTDPDRMTAVVLCGGAGRRFGGDKTRALVAGLPLLDHVLAALPASWPVVCVGGQRPTAREVIWCREDPPGGGPVAALAAGLTRITTPSVVVLGGDMPHAGSAAVTLATALAEQPAAEAVVGRDGEGRLQPLLAAYRLAPLRRALPTEPAGTPLMRVLDAMDVVPLQLEGWVSADVDTPDDLRAARHRLGE